MSELPLALEVDYFRVAKDRYSVPISVKIPGSAIGLQKKGAKQVADLDVSCSQAGANVSLDGQPLISCPGTQLRRVSPGRHQVVASKDGFLTKTSDVVIAGGETQHVGIELVPLSAATIGHRWAEWKPWRVMWNCGNRILMARRRWRGIVQWPRPAVHACVC